jgi:hypothetical protein
MTAVTGRIPRDLVEAPVRSPETVRAIGDAIWLYLRFLSLATTSGHACRAQALLARDLGTTVEQVDRWLATLVEALLISVVSPGPFLVVKLSLWPSSDMASEKEHGESAEFPAPDKNNVPGSSKQLAAAASSNLRDGGLGEGSELEAEALAVLGPESHDEVRESLEGASAPLVRRALRRVALTPDRQIKKSRLALFRSLLTKLSDEHA